MTNHLPRIFITEEQVNGYRALLADKSRALLPTFNDYVGGIADFSKFPLRRADLSGFNLTGADFSICMATQTCFDNAILTDACFIAARLEQCSFRNIHGWKVNWSHALLKENVFDNAALEHNYFEGTRIVHSSFRNANLRQSHFAKAWLRDCELEDAIVTFTLFDPAWMLEHIHHRDMLVSLTQDKETEPRALRKFSGLS